MAEDDQDRAQETAAEREAEINSEMERVGQDPDQVQDGSDSLGTQSAPSGTTRNEGAGDTTDGPDETEEAVEDSATSEEPADEDR